jgi:hypothetical protein
VLKPEPPAPARSPPAQADRRHAAPVPVGRPAGPRFDAEGPARIDSLAGLLARSVGERAVARGAYAHPAAGLVQREAKVEEDPAKLDFLVSRFGDEARKIFRNAREQEIDAAVRLVDAAWRTAYESGTEGERELTKLTASKVPPRQDLLKALGKSGADLKGQDAYKLLTGVMDATFHDDADHAFNYKPTKVAKVGLGTVYALQIVQDDDGAIEPEDKSTDPRRTICLNDNIVKTGADTAATATVLYELDDPKKHEEIETGASAWELHAHVRRDGSVAFAHTKKDNTHYQVVNDWFDANIPEEERVWQ